MEDNQFGRNFYMVDPALPNLESHDVTHFNHQSKLQKLNSKAYGKMPTKVQPTNEEVIRSSSLFWPSQAQVIRNQSLQHSQSAVKRKQNYCCFGYIDKRDKFCKNFCKIAIIIPLFPFVFIYFLFDKFICPCCNKLCDKLGKCIEIVCDAIERCMQKICIALCRCLEKMCNLFCDCLEAIFKPICKCLGKICEILYQAIQNCCRILEKVCKPLYDCLNKCCDAFMRCLKNCCTALEKCCVNCCSIILNQLEKCFFKVSNCFRIIFQAFGKCFGVINKVICTPICKGIQQIYEFLVKYCFTPIWKFISCVIINPLGMILNFIKKMCIIIAKSIGKCCSLVYFEVGVVLERVCRKIQSFIECEDSDD